MMQLHISGRLVRNPETKTSSKGTPYVHSLLTVSHNDGDTLVTLMAFDTTLQSLLSGLQKGDSLSAIGAGSVRAYAGKDGAPAAGVTLIANRVMAMGEAKAPPRQRSNGNGNWKSTRANNYAGAAPGGEHPPLEAYDDIAF